MKEKIINILAVIFGTMIILVLLALAILALSALIFLISILWGN